MELASMLAGEPFGDHPRSVCPVIGAVLRRYNDSVDDRRRQDLYRCAAQVVGTRGTTDLRRARLERVAAWTLELRGRRRKWYWLPERWQGMTLARTFDEDLVAERAILEARCHGDGIHPEVLALVDELIAMDPSQPELTNGEDPTAREPTPEPSARGSR